MLLAFTAILARLDAEAISLWVGQSYTWDFGGAVMGTHYNLSVSSDGGYLSITGSGLYRTITPTQYFGGSATITAEWDYTLYYGDTKRHQKVTLTVTCNENPVSISPQSVTLAPGETFQLGYSHKYDNEYVRAANAYFSGGNSSFTVSSSGLITGKSPGTGYVNIYSNLSDNSKAPYCTVTVKEVPPTAATLSNINLFADQTTELAVSLSPSNATVKSKQWSVKSGSDVVNISGQYLTGLKSGTATIYCTVNGTVRSNDATVTVTEPKLTTKSTTPENGATGISVFATPSVTYSHALSKGTDFSNIALTSNGIKVDGSVTIDGNTLRYIPAKPLSPQTNYKLTVPGSAIKNKWGSAAQSDASISFKTGDLEKATVTMTPASGSYLTRNEAVTLSASPSTATIYYTTDGSDPTQKSPVYTSPIKEDRDFTLKALAICEGYETSEIAVGEFYQSAGEIVECYPNDTDVLFSYALVSPYLKLSGPVEKSNNFDRISLKDKDGNPIDGSVYITNCMIVFVTEKTFENCNRYTVDIPHDAVKAKNGEVFKGFSWTFTTPVMPSDIAMQGDETVNVLSEKGIVTSRGRMYFTTYTDGSFDYRDINDFSILLGNYTGLSGGYYHSLVKSLSTVGGLGRMMCDVSGTPASISSIGEIKSVRAGFQTSAIIGTDNSLWMCGRNDFYQLGDNSGTTAKEFIKVAENVIDVALGNGYTLYVDTDNVLWGVGRNHRGQLGDGSQQNRRKPVKIMEGVEKAFASVSGYFSGCITTDHKLFTWGTNESGQLGRDGGDLSATPESVLDNVISASLGHAHVLAICNDNKLYSWGSNGYDQIAKTGEEVKVPTVMAENVKAVSAGPYTSLILTYDGKITGWGKIIHSNFGEGEGKATDLVIHEGREYSPLKGATIEPESYEVLPERDFAFVAKSLPNSADYDMVEWSSDHPEIASVDNRGVIHTASKGNATITVKLTDRYGASTTAKAVVICTDNPVNSAISDVTDETETWYAYSIGTTIIVEKTTIGQRYTIFNLQGVNVGSQLSDGQQITFDIPQSGIYIIQSGNKAVKVLCQ